MINRSFVRQWASAPEGLRLGDKVEEVTLYISGIQYRYLLCQYSSHSMFPTQSSALYLYIYIFILIFSSCAAHRGLIPPRLRGFVITHNDAPQPVGLLWTSDQLVAETSTWQHTQQTNIPAPDGIRTHDSSRQAAVDLRLRPRGHCDKLTHKRTHIYIYIYIYVFMWVWGRGPDSSVSIETHYGLEGSEIDFRWERNYPHLSRPALWSAQPPIQWILGLFVGGNVDGAWRWPPTPI
jgi:hypothetical protein